ncbi:hypothetical protein BDV26DRAFT_275289 [Aspergillus bertholletiae]|uniref:Uncharacterized protein n=1 Tax=Aspergillus bertholletiae TaxID=1226010 RepID=A0A5N7ARB5_9EURO|nr:hypothetical protein BDV26DRAFT_275289 [Aspergillus bertholletiae]
MSEAIQVPQTPEIAIRELSEVPETPAAAEHLPPPASTAHGSSFEDFQAAQVADQPRWEWIWHPRGKSSEPYTPAVVGKWWSHSEAELAQLQPARRSNIGHIYRIMETELGEQLLGDARCTYCKERDVECWAYSSQGQRQVSRPGSACARCRIEPYMDGCSLSRRTPNKSKYIPLPTRHYRPLQPKDGGPPLPLELADQVAFRFEILAGITNHRPVRAE